jgi:predicted phosphodiesterase
MSLEQKVRAEMSKVEKTIVIPDMHCPYEDWRALEGVYKFAKDYKPDNVVLLGDLVDFYTLSRFDKDPSRILGLQHELDVAQYHLKKLRAAVGKKTKIILLEGNHEKRLEKYLRKNPEMSSLRCVNNIPNLLNLQEQGVSYRGLWFNKGVLFKHGHIVRRHGAYTARGEYESEGTSGMSGHSHRMGAHYKTDRSGNHAWFECGHLCDEAQAEYMEGKVPDWQKGFALFEYDGRRKVWRANTVPIINNSFLHEGKLYSWNTNQKNEERPKP